MPVKKTAPFKKLTPKEEIDLDELIAEAERFFGSPSKGADKSKSKTASSDKTKSKPADPDKPKGKTASSDKAKSKPTDSDKPKGKTASSDKAKSKPADSDKPKGKTAPSDKAKSKPADSDKPKGKTAPSDKTKSKPADSDKPKGKTASSDKAKSKTADSDKPKGKTAPSDKAKSKPADSDKHVSVRGYGSSIKRTHPSSISPIKEFFGRIPKWVVRLPVLLLCVLMVWMFCEANVVHLKSADLFLPQLPYAFKGTRVLYLSDLHINSLNSPSKVNAMIDQIMQLEPDLLLLGGDYTSSDPLMYAGGALSGSTAAEVQSDMRDLFFENLAQYDPPLGKFAVAGEHDNLLDGSGAFSLAAAAAKGGVTLLRNEAVRIERGGQSIVIMGIDDWTYGEKKVRGLSEDVSASDCVIVLCHDPEAVPLINSYPVSDGFWIDFALCGHTHGGFFRLGSFEVFNFTSDRQRFAAGWHLENTARVLISRGVANDLLPLRFFAAPEVHLITLK